MIKVFKKYWICIVSILLMVVISGYFIFVEANKTKDIVQKTEIRTVDLSNNNMDYQSILSGFEKSELETIGSLTTFSGYQCIDPNILSEIDNVNEDDIETAQDCHVFYRFSYDVESNIVTIYAYMQNEIGEIEIDEVNGVAFLNERNEIDAVMNFDGEGILLSDMRNAGMIQNCGWFAKLVKKIAIAVAVVTTVVAVAAVCVATCGTAAVAVAGVGVSMALTTGAAATAMAIAGYATFTAALSAGIALTAGLVEKYYPGTDAVDTTINGRKTTTIQWNNVKTKGLLKDLIIAEVATNKKPENKLVYFHVLKYNDRGPVTVDLTAYDYNIMKTNMRIQGWSSITLEMIDAQNVIQGAFNMPATLDTHNGRSLPHYHIVLTNKSHLTAGPYNYTVHSYFFA